MSSFDEEQLCLTFGKRCEETLMRKCDQTLGREEPKRERECVISDSGRNVVKSNIKTLNQAGNELLSHCWRHNGDT